MGDVLRRGDNPPDTSYRILFVPLVGVRNSNKRRNVSSKLPSVITPLTKLPLSIPLVARKFLGNPVPTARLTMCPLVKLIAVFALVRTTLFRTVKSVAMFLAAGLARIATHKSFVPSRPEIVMSIPVTRTKDTTFLRTSVLFEVAKMTTGSPLIAVCLNVCANPLLIIPFTSVTTKPELTIYKVIPRPPTNVVFAIIVLLSFAPLPVTPNPPLHLGNVSGPLLGTSVPYLLKAFLLMTSETCLHVGTSKPQV